MASPTEGIRAIAECHASNLDDLADSLAADGIGLHPTRGHGVFLKRMASSLRAAAAQGQLPHQFDPAGQGLYASGAALPEPQPHAQRVMRLCGIELGPSEQTTIAAVDAAVRKAGDRVTRFESIGLKTELERIGRIRKVG